MLQWVTLHYKILQKQSNLKTCLKVAQEVISLKKVISCSKNFCVPEKKLLYFERLNNKCTRHFNQQRNLFTMRIRFLESTNLTVSFAVLRALREQTYQKVQRIKFAELEKNLKMNTTKPNQIYIIIERSISLDISLRILLEAHSDIFNKVDTQ